MVAPKSRGRGALGGFLGLIGLSAIAGVLAAAVVVPAVAIGGVTANTAASIFTSLPSNLNPGELAEPSIIYAKDGDSDVKLATFYYENRRSISIDRMGQWAPLAAIAAEDERYYDHNGVDMTGMLRAAVVTLSGAGFEGASTITMQYVRNILVLKAVQTGDDQAVADAMAPTAERKLQEMKYAIGLENEYSKEDILQGYLNSINFGGVYGIEAAARKYFSKSSSKLTVGEAAALIGIVQYPEAYRLDLADDNKANGKDGGYAANTERRDDILNRMERLGYITQEQYEEAIATPTVVDLSSDPSGCQYARADANFFCEFVQWELANSDALSTDPDERYNKLVTGGYRIYTTLDLKLQKTAQKEIDKAAPADQKGILLGGSITTVEPGTGRILAMAQNRDYDATNSNPESKKSTSINYAANYAQGGSTGFQAGSTFKIFTLTDWFKTGHAANTMVNGTSPQTYTGSQFSDRCLGSTFPSISLRNSGNDSRPSISIAGATEASINTAYWSMAKQLDLCDIRETAESLGVTRADGNDWNPGISMVVGSEEVSPLSMAAAYAAIAAEGKYCEPTGIDRIRQVVDGSVQDVPYEGATCTQAVTKEVADAVVWVMKRGFLGTGQAATPGNGMPAFIKTGTTAEFDGSLVSAATPKAATFIWIGNVIGHVNLMNTINHVTGSNLWNSKFAAMKTMLLRIDDLYGEGSDWDDPPSKLMQGKPVEVPDVLGLSAEQAQKNLEANGFDVQVSDTSTLSDAPRGEIAKQNPEGGTKVPEGSAVVIYKSNGKGAVAPSVAGLDQAGAEQAYRDAGFRGSITFRQKQSTSVAAGIVASSSVSAGRMYERDTDITIVISSGPPGGGNGGDDDDDDDEGPGGGGGPGTP